MLHIVTQRCFISMKQLTLIALVFFSATALAKSKTSTLYIADRFTLCDTTECMQMKIKKSAAWQVATTTISDFVYEEGYEYKLKISTDLETGEQKLVKVLYKKKTGYNPATKLEGRRWYLKSMYDGNGSLRLGDTTCYIDIDVTQGSVSGRGVCNRLKGTAKGDGKTITFSDLAYTRMKCVDQGNVMETIITNLLSATSTYERRGRSMLILHSAKGSYMVFESL